MSNDVVKAGPGLPALLTVLFVGLKLVGVINWSWWWVFSPLWIGFGLGLIGLGIAIIVALLLR